MKLKNTLVLGLFLFWQTSSIYAWCEEGHRLIEKIATHYLNSSTKDSLKFYLAAQDFKQTKNSLNLCDSTNTNLNPSFGPCLISKDHTSVRLVNTCLVSNCELLIYNLKHRHSKISEVAENLRLLFKLIADAHQPFRSTPSKNCGEQKMFWAQISKELDAYDAWDRLLVQDGGISLDKCLSIQFNKAQWKKYYPDVLPESHEKLKTISVFPIDWQNTSSHLMQYLCLNETKNEAEYFKRCKPILMVQLHNAGFNIALVLKKIFV